MPSYSVGSSFWLCPPIFSLGFFWGGGVLFCFVFVWGFLWWWLFSKDGDVFALSEIVINWDMHQSLIFSLYIALKIDAYLLFFLHYIKKNKCHLIIRFGKQVSSFCVDSGGHLNIR